MWELHTEVSVRIFFFKGSSAHSMPKPLIQFHDHFSQMVGLLGWVISPSQGRYLHRTTQTQKKLIHTPNIHALSGFQTHNLSIQASENSSCLGLCGYCDQCSHIIPMWKVRGASPDLLSCTIGWAQLSTCGWRQSPVYRTSFEKKNRMMSNVWK
jgi:hypothetical protein